VENRKLRAGNASVFPVPGAARLTVGRSRFFPGQVVFRFPDSVAGSKLKTPSSGLSALLLSAPTLVAHGPLRLRRPLLLPHLPVLRRSLLLPRGPLRSGLPLLLGPGFLRAGLSLLLSPGFLRAGLFLLFAFGLVHPGSFLLLLPQLLMFLNLGPLVILRPPLISEMSPLPVRSRFVVLDVPGPFSSPMPAIVPFPPIVMHVTMVNSFIPPRVSVPVPVPVESPPSRIHVKVEPGNMTVIAPASVIIA